MWGLGGLRGQVESAGMGENWGLPGSAGGNGGIRGASWICRRDQVD